MTAGVVITETTFISAEHRGHARGSTSNAEGETGYCTVRLRGGFRERPKVHAGTAKRGKSGQIATSPSSAPAEDRDRIPYLFSPSAITSPTTCLSPRDSQRIPENLLQG
jgi:hypothetical protein